MEDNKKITSALISVFYKDGIDEIAKQLHAQGVKIFSTGGTRTFIEAMNIPVTDVETLTGYPSIFGGRVKTLHPAVFGGILQRRNNESDKAEALEYKIPVIDLVIVDLYPFEQTLAQGASPADIIEKIDVGGVALIRAAAKNFNDTVIISSKDDYHNLLQIITTQNSQSTLAQRKQFAAKAFAITSHYDSAICKWFDTDNVFFKCSSIHGRELRYGENPHQQAKFFGNINEIFTQLNGKEISYNNLLDIEAALGYIKEFDEPAVAIIKHNNACGIATAKDLQAAYSKALAGDPVSAFGGVVVANRKIDLSIAKIMNTLFMEVLIAPEFDTDAFELLNQKKNRIILQLHKQAENKNSFRNLLNGVLVQDKDVANDVQRNVVTATQPTTQQLDDMDFAMKVCKHHKSNAIVLARDGQLLGSGCGMTSRIDALKHAIAKAHEFGFDLQNAAMASDAFFPFPDCVEIAHKAGITSIIQPGGSMRDNETVDYCNANNLPMIITGMRHFKH